MQAITLFIEIGCTLVFLWPIFLCYMGDAGPMSANSIRRTYYITIMFVTFDTILAAAELAHVSHIDKMPTTSGLDAAIVSSVIAYVTLMLLWRKRFFLLLEAKARGSRWYILFFCIRLCLAIAILVMYGIAGEWWAFTLFAITLTSVLSIDMSFLLLVSGR
jgi:hypothetical protein